MKVVSITIIGCGRRVRQDVVASALSSGILKDKIQILSRKSRKILIRDKIYYIKELDKEEIIGDIIYLAIPPYEIKNLIINNLEKIGKKLIIIDTPIVDNELNKLIKNPLVVAEDVYPLLKILMQELNIKKFNFLYFYKSFFKYHGICFIETMLGDIKFMLNLKLLKIFFASRGIVLVLGNKNYENGFISLNLRNINFPKLDSDGINLIGGITENDSVSYRFLDLKRLGLREIISNPLKYANEKYLNIESGYFQYTLSKKKIFFNSK